MTIEWTPDPETGLQGDDVHLSERIEIHATPTEARRPGCYALRCSTPDTNDVAAYKSAWLQSFYELPDDLEAIAAADELLYVGAAKDTYARLSDHVRGEKRKSALLSVFPPHSIRDVFLMDSKSEAFQRESRIAMELQADNPDKMVWQR